MITRTIQASLLFATICSAGPAIAGEPIVIQSVQVTLIDDISVPAQEAGLLSEVRVAIGTKVKAGEILGRLDQSKAKLTVSQAEIDVAIEELNAKNDVKVRFARKSKQVADSELARAIESDKRFKGSVSESQMDILRLTAERAALSIEEADRDQNIARMTLKLKKNTLLNAKDGVRRREITTTVPGIVADVKRQAGEWVEPGQTVFRVIRLDRLRVKGFAKAADLSGDLMGRAVTVNVNLYGRRNVSFPGKITFVSSEIDPNNGEVAVWAEVSNPGYQLKPGMTGSMRINAGFAANRNNSRR